MYFFLFQAGANMIVSGTAVVRSDNPKETILYLRRAVEEVAQSQLVRWPRGKPAEEQIDRGHSKALKFSVA